MNKVFLSLVFAAFLGAPCFAQNAVAPAVAAPEAAAAPVEKPAHHRHERHERHPEIKRALHDLYLAKEHLEKAAHDFGGHKAKALAAIKEAMEQLHDAMNSDAK